MARKDWRFAEEALAVEENLGMQAVEDSRLDRELNALLREVDQWVVLTMLEGLDIDEDPESLSEAKLGDLVESLDLQRLLDKATARGFSVDEETHEAESGSPGGPAGGSAALVLRKLGFAQEIVRRHAEARVELWNLAEEALRRKVPPCGELEVATLLDRARHLRISLPEVQERRERISRLAAALTEFLERPIFPEDDLQALLEMFQEALEMGVEERLAIMARKKLDRLLEEKRTQARAEAHAPGKGEDRQPESDPRNEALDRDAAAPQQGWQRRKERR